MKRGLIAVCAFLGLLVLAEGGFALYFDYARLKVDENARQFVNTAVVRIAANWDEAAFREYADDNAISSANSQRERFHVLGKLTHYDPARGYTGLAGSFPAFPWSAATGYYTADITCEHGTARIGVGVALRDGVWKIKVFSILNASARPK